MGADGLNQVTAQETAEMPVGPARRPSLFRRTAARVENAFWTACVGLVLLRLVSKGK
jgi:hypothetical protein